MQLLKAAPSSALVVPIWSMRKCCKRLSSSHNCIALHCIVLHCQHAGVTISFSTSTCSVLLLFRLRFCWEPVLSGDSFEALAMEEQVNRSALFFAAVRMLATMPPSIGRGGSAFCPSAPFHVVGCTSTFLRINVSFLTAACVAHTSVMCLQS